MNFRLRHASPLILLLASCVSDSKARPPTEAAAPADSVEPTAIQVVPLQYAVAGELAVTLNNLLGESARAFAPGLDPTGGGARRDSNAPAVRSKPPTRIVADPRTNSLIVRASPKDILSIVELIGRLDRKVE